jgi:hypothetical protein
MDATASRPPDLRYSKLHFIPEFASFDVAITAEDTATGGAKVKVLSGILGGDIGGEKGSKNSVASRIQFAIPVLLPSHDSGNPAAATPKRMKINPEAIGKF